MKSTNKIINSVKKAYAKLKYLNPNQRKSFSQKIVIKGKNSEFDSVDVVTFFLILDKELRRNKINAPNLLDQNFFFKFKNLNIGNLIKFLNDKK
jgi:hypothetical protein